ncbi:NXPE family member 3-like [Bufo gargarizans]|uniref:NXPE family member 3-like n=1 Tax=Bufo gargarizans TaxID=30331 RepID=UPI001CF36E2E|nr:NXPE family member 3-like [Bufo gargarizans]
MDCREPASSNTVPWTALTPAATRGSPHSSRPPAARADSGGDRKQNAEIIFQLLTIRSPGKWYPPPVSFLSSNASRVLKTSSNLDQEEIQGLIQLIQWPKVPSGVDFMSSTSPKTTFYVLLHPQEVYNVGDRITVVIFARDHYSRPKTCGGDYFLAKLHSPKLKAGVTGAVTDHRNGRYSVTFLLLWPGDAEVHISLIHSSEAVSILSRKRDKFYLNGHFIHNGSSATVKCNVQPPGPDVCTYRNVQSREEWFCNRPKGFPCSAYQKHLTGVNHPTLNATEQQFLQRPVTDQMISSTLRKIIILPQTSGTDERSLCRPGLSIPEPSGYYYQDEWQSRVCRNKHFTSPSDVTACLKGKVVYLFGDSTLRQWWLYLVKFVPSLQKASPNVSYALGSLLATDAEHGYLLKWRVHQMPLSMIHTSEQKLAYIANELDNIGGGDDGLVIVINCNAHFVSFPVTFYLQRIRNIRNAVVRLLKRSPQTKVIIKSGNTGFRYEIASDWLSFQLDTLMRAVFSGLPVALLDAWQMTSCHYLPKDLHPKEIIIKNMVDSMLSYICPE